MTNAFTITDQIIITTDGTVVVLKEDGTKLFGAKPPIFSFEYKALSFMQSQQMYLTTEGVDAQLNDDQQLEICNYLKTTEENAALSAALQSSTTARAYLARTDWYVTRKAETGVEIPTDIATARTEARTNANFDNALTAANLG